MKRETERVIRAAMALQVTALIWDEDDTPVQAEARQALINMTNSLEELHKAVATMGVMTNHRRRAKK